MKPVSRLLLLLCFQPLVAQDWIGLPFVDTYWDARAELSMPRAQDIPSTQILSTGQRVSGSLDRGRGGTISLNRGMYRVGPVLNLEAGVEYTWWNAGGAMKSDSMSSDLKLAQKGFGVGIFAQFWVPFTGVAGEVGLIERFQTYKLDASGVSKQEDLSRTWLRLGARWRFPNLGMRPYVAISYQQPLFRDRPASMEASQDLTSYLAAQGSGQEFERMWTLGVGVQF